jgi:hypothetical protein
MKAIVFFAVSVCFSLFMFGFEGAADGFEVVGTWNGGCGYRLTSSACVKLARQGEEVVVMARAGALSADVGSIR